MVGRVPGFLLVASLTLALVPVAGAQRTGGVSVRVVQPEGDDLRFGSTTPRGAAPRQAPGRALSLVVVIPIGAAYGPACPEVHVLARLAGMTSAGRAMADDLSVGKALLCSGLRARLDRWPSGRRATSLSGGWFYPNGERASALGGSWYYPDGSRARGLTDTWYYPNGVRARNTRGRWYAPNGTRIGQLHQPTDALVTVSILERLWHSLGSTDALGLR
ncbi:MAG: hypothetical protein ACODAU_11650 [Myxococcota bacterium]